MGVLDTIKDMLVPDTEPGVQYECIECGETFERDYQQCPVCGSTEIKEIEGFDMRPDT
jgi:rubrerythrin